MGGWAPLRFSAKLSPLKAGHEENGEVLGKKMGLKGKKKPVMAEKSSDIMGSTSSGDTSEASLRNYGAFWWSPSQARTDTGHGGAGPAPLSPAALETTTINQFGFFTPKARITPPYSQVCSSQTGEPGTWRAEEEAKPRPPSPNICCHTSGER